MMMPFIFLFFWWWVWGCGGFASLRGSRSTHRAAVDAFLVWGLCFFGGVEGWVVWMPLFFGVDLGLWWFMIWGGWIASIRVGPPCRHTHTRQSDTDKTTARQGRKDMYCFCAYPSGGCAWGRARALRCGWCPACRRSGRGCGVSV